MNREALERTLSVTFVVVWYLHDATRHDPSRRCARPSANSEFAYKNNRRAFVLKWFPCTYCTGTIPLPLLPLPGHLSFDSSCPCALRTPTTTTALVLNFSERKGKPSRRVVAIFLCRLRKNSNCLGRWRLHCWPPTTSSRFLLVQPVLPTHS